MVHKKKLNIKDAKGNNKDAKGTRSNNFLCN